MVSIPIKIKGPNPLPAKKSKSKYTTSSILQHKHWNFQIRLWNFHNVFIGPRDLVEKIWVVHLGNGWLEFKKLRALCYCFIIILKNPLNKNAKCVVELDPYACKLIQTHELSKMKWYQTISLACSSSGLVPLSFLGLFFLSCP